MELNSYMKPILDAALNIISTFLPLALLQLIVLPAMANGTSTDTYATIVTMLSVFNLFPGTLGNTINNVRLVYRAKYEREKHSGDFQILFLCSCILSIVSVVGAVVAYRFATPFSCLLLGAVAFCWVAREYYCVEFRLALDYRKVLFSNIWLSVGYAIGYIVFHLTGLWELVYLIGQAASLLYILHNTKLHKEPPRKGARFHEVAAESAELGFSNVLARGLAYADRLMLYPLLGGNSVTIYYVSSLAGKLLSTAIGPINSVVLSYLARREEKPVAAFRRSLALCSVLCIATYFVIQLLAPYILHSLYPVYATSALQYVGIVSIASLVYVLISVVSPFTLRYYAMKWQLAINGVGLVLYIMLGFLLASAHGLMGFCFATLIANIVKLTLLVGLFLFVESDTKA